MSPLERYQQDLESGRILPDSSQTMATEKLQQVYQRLEARRSQRPSLMKSLLRHLRGAPLTPVKGLYLWGGVGRGKTYLMDLFYHCLPGERKLRMHFHRFMQMVHRQLHANQGKGEAEPLARVAEDIAGRTDVICFDEFFVSDIGDAMIMANLLEHLFAAGVTLVATSNIAPERLYENGLQRKSFLPAIALIQAHTDVMNMDGELDYRLRRLEQAEIYHSPLDDESRARMRVCFEELASGQEVEQDCQLEILGRDIHALCCAEGLVWFDFNALCEGPRSTADYIEIAQLFHTVLLSEVPVMAARAHDRDRARRFISIVDEFYDHNVKLIISAAAPVQSLYQGKDLAFPFQRTVSRLQEMQSHDYLAREHRP